MQWCWNLTHDHQIAIAAAVLVFGVVIVKIFGKDEVPAAPAAMARPPTSLRKPEGKKPATQTTDTRDADAPAKGDNASEGPEKKSGSMSIQKTQEMFLKKVIVKRSKTEQLEEQLAQLRLAVASTGQHNPQPTAEARELAQQITEDDGGYAQALKAIAEGRYEQAQQLLDDAQVFLEGVQEQKEEAQTKIYVARMQNESYASRYLEALKWCNLLEPLAGDDPGLLDSVAFIYFKNGDYKKAELLYKRALALDEKSLGPKHPDVANRLDSLATIYRAQGEYARAEKAYSRALAIREELLGPRHPDVAQSLNNLAELCRIQGEHAQAELLYSRCQSIWEEALGPDHPDVAVALNNLGTLYRVQSKYSLAEPLLTRALEIRAQAFGNDHPNVAVSLNNLGMLYKAQRHFAKAEPLYKRAIEIDEKAYGPEHPDVARDLSNLSVMYCAQGKFLEAEPLIVRALAILEKVYGPQHPKVQECWRNVEALHSLKNG